MSGTEADMMDQEHLSVCVCTFYLILLYVALVAGFLVSGLRPVEGRVLVIVLAGLLQAALPGGGGQRGGVVWRDGDHRHALLALLASKAVNILA